VPRSSIATTGEMSVPGAVERAEIVTGGFQRPPAGREAAWTS